MTKLDMIYAILKVDSSVSVFDLIKLDINCVKNILANTVVQSNS